MRDAPGRRIRGKYELVERAGEGGMAVVWRAITLGAQGFERPVAIKRAHPTLAADADFAAMFVEEARVTATLDHPNIVHIHDFGEDEHGDHFLVMEWVEGVDLRRLGQAFAASGERLPWQVAAVVIADVLRGLHAAHTRVTAEDEPAPIYHRDITPQNVLLATNGAVKLTDFGLARAMDRARVTTPGVVKGKLAYLAPELTIDQPPSAQTDVFAVGIVLWEILAGQRLFDGDNDRDIFYKVARAQVPPILVERDDIPPALADVVHTALAREPSARWKDARAMEIALHRVLRALPDPADHQMVAVAVRAARQTLGLGTASRRPLAELEAEDARKKAAVRAALFGGPVPESEASGAIPLPLSRRKPS